MFPCHCCYSFTVICIVDVSEPIFTFVIFDVANPAGTCRQFHFAGVLSDFSTGRVCSSASILIGVTWLFRSILV